MSNSINRFRFDETFACAQKTIDLHLDLRHPDSHFICDYIAILVSKNSDLHDSIVFHEQLDQAADSDTADALFVDSFKTFRTIVETNASVVELKEKATSCQEISAIINRHGRTLYEKSKAIQMILWESIATECSINSPKTIIDQADVRLYFDIVCKNHLALKTIESARTETVVVKGSISSPTDISNSIKPFLNKFHTHFADYAFLKNSLYEESLAILDAAWDPIVQPVKNRIAKGSNPAPTPPVEKSKSSE